MKKERNDDATLLDWEKPALADASQIEDTIDDEDALKKNNISRSQNASSKSSTRSSLSSPPSPRLASATSLFADLVYVHPR